jgi:hypothetical protein
MKEVSSTTSLKESTELLNKLGILNSYYSPPKTKVSQFLVVGKEQVSTKEGLRRGKEVWQNILSVPAFSMYFL